MTPIRKVPLCILDYFISKLIDYAYYLLIILIFIRNMRQNPGGYNRPIIPSTLARGGIPPYPPYYGARVDHTSHIVVITHVRTPLYNMAHHKYNVSCMKEIKQCI